MRFELIPRRSGPARRLSGRRPRDEISNSGSGLPVLAHPTPTVNHESHPPSPGENPYQSPAWVEPDSSNDDFLTDGERRRLVDLKRILRYQLCVVLFIQIQVGFYVYLGLGGRFWSSFPSIRANVVIVIVLIVALVGVFVATRLANELSRSHLGHVLGAVSLIPLLGLFVLLALLRKSGKVLSRNRIKVSVFGTVTREFEPRTDDETL